MRSMGDMTLDANLAQVHLNKKIRHYFIQNTYFCTFAAPKLLTDGHTFLYRGNKVPT